MMAFNRDIYEREQQLLKELKGMKFSFKKLRKLIELDALVNYNK